MKSTDELMKEHRGIELMLRVLEALAERARAGERLVQGDLDGIVEFLTVFADQCHHGKEEELLFPAMEAGGLSRHDGPIGMMLAEHIEGRQHIARLTAAVDAYRAGRGDAAEDFASAALDYAGLLSQHIEKEDEVLYPMAEDCLDAATDARLVKAFEDLERDRIGAGRHEQFHALLHRLERAYLA